MPAATTIFIALLATSTATAPAPEASLVRVGGRAVYLRCSAPVAGAAVVVLEAGINQASDTWEPIIPGVASFARVCAYDRAGLGRSEPAGEEPRTAKQIAGDLHAVLSAAKIPPPYVLVGHSFGGLLARSYASLYPREVAGLVLIDSSHEEEVERWLALLPPDVRRVLEEQGGRRLLGSEPIDIDRAHAEAKAARWKGDIPVAVIARGRDSFNPEDFPPMLRQYAPEGEKLRIALQEDLASRSPRGTLVFAERSGHFIHHDEPAVVVRAIRSVVDAVTQRR